MKIIHLTLLSLIYTTKGRIVRQTVLRIRPLQQPPDRAIDTDRRHIIITSRLLPTDNNSSTTIRANGINLFFDHGVHRVDVRRLFRPLLRSSNDTLSRIPSNREDHLNVNPHQASLRVGRGSRAFRHKCGGSLVAARWVLTAAHCVNNVTTSSMRIIMGDYDLTREDPYEKTYSVIQSWVHPHYQLTPGTFSNDVALVKLDRSAISPGITPIALYGGPATFAGQACTITGWGKRARTHESMVLNEAKIPVISNRQCSAMWRRNPDAIIVPFHICGFAPNISVCNLARMNNFGTLHRRGQLYGSYLECMAAAWTISTIFETKIDREVAKASNYFFFIHNCSVNPIVEVVVMDLIFCGFRFAKGDSGGPMVCEGLLAGVASWTIKGCGAKNPHGTFPSVYVRVSHYIDWIMNTIRANNFV